MKNILILEDNLAQRQALSLIVQEVSDTINVLSAGSFEEASVIVFRDHIDIFVVDIILEPHKYGDVSGIQFISKLRQMDEYAFAPVIITTSLEDPEAYLYKQLKCIDYIEKPYKPERIKSAIEKCMKFPRVHQGEKSKIIFREDGILWPVNIEDIRFLESRNHTIYLHRTSGEINRFSYQTIKGLLKEVSDGALVQCSRSALVNINYVQKVDIVNGFIELKGENMKIEIGSTYKRKLKEIFKLD